MLNTKPWFLLHGQRAENTGAMVPSVPVVGWIQALMYSELRSACIPCPPSNAKTTGRGLSHHLLNSHLVSHKVPHCYLDCIVSSINEQFSSLSEFSCDQTST